MTERTSALNLIRKLGEEVSWEMLQCEGLWYVTASNNPRSPGGFKFSAAGKTLTGCIKSVYQQATSHGPKWLRGEVA